MMIRKIIRMILLILFCVSMIYSLEPSEYPLSIYTAFDEDDAGIINIDLIVELPSDTHITSDFLSIEIFPDEDLEIADTLILDPIFHFDDIIYRDNVSFRSQIDLKEIQGEKEIGFRGKISYQICEELPFEQCLPPVERSYYLKIRISVFDKEIEILKFEEIDDIPVKEEEEVIKEEKIIETSQTPVISGSRLEKALAGNILYALLIVFIAGILTSFTPCVYPMIPITISIFSKDNEGGNTSSFIKSIFYVLGLAFTYSILGLISGMTGALFGSIAQSPVFIFPISIILFLMSLSMFGVFDIHLPSSLQDKITGGRKKGFAGIFLLGMVFGLIAAPCAGPIVITILTYIAATQSPLLGFVLLFAYALGLGLLLIVIGTFSGMLSSLPRAGNWMVLFKHFFGYAILILIVYFISPLISNTVESYLYGFFILLLAIFFIREVFSNINDSTLKNITLAIGIVLILLSCRYLAENIFPLGIIRGVQEKEEQLEWYYDIDEGIEKAGLENKGYMLDFTADWCAYCKEMERTTFRDPRIIKLFESYILIKIDLTVINEENRRIMEEYSIRGLPMIIFYDEDGEEVLRIDHFINADDMYDLLKEIN